MRASDAASRFCGKGGRIWPRPAPAWGTVRWEQTIRKMLADGVDTFIEIGPGKTLTGFMRKIDKNAKAFNIEKLEDIDKVKEALGC